MVLSPEDIDINAVAAHAPVGWAVSDLEGNWVMGNAAYAELFGRSLDEMPLRHIEELTHPDDRDRAVDLVGRLAGGDLDRTETDVGCLRSDGSAFAGHLAASLIRGDDGCPLAVVTVIADVSGTKEAQLQLAAMRDRALALAEQRAGFVASVSHELRVPLHAVLGLTELLADRVHDPRDLELVSGVRREAERLRDTVDDLLDYSRFEANGIVIEPGAIDVAALVDRVLMRAAAAGHASGLVVEGMLDPAVPSVIEADEHRLEQVLTNLLGNAVKFTEEGEVRLTVRAADGHRIQFEVRDTGPGIPAEHHQLVFEPFRQVPGRRSSVGGTGLGLALVRGLVGLMQGTITLECPPGGGTTFRVEVPAPAGQLVDASRAPAGPGAPPRQASVLVVEDNAVNQVLVRQQLERLGHSSTIVGTATEGLDILVRPDHGHDLVFMDWQLPDIDGLEATRRLRAAERGRGAHVPVIAMTASAMPEDRAACRAAGMDGFLAKPVSLRELEEMIALWAPAVGRHEDAARHATHHMDGLDRTALDSLVSDLGDRSLVVSLVERYLSELDERERAVRAAADTVQLDVLHRIGHTLRSTSEMMGVSELRDLCRELEAIASPTALPDFLPRFVAAAERARASLVDWAGPNQGSGS